MFTAKRSIVQRAWFLPACTLFGVVCWIATATSQSISRSGDPGSTSSFTLTGEIPAHSALRATAEYAPSGSAQHCNYPPATLHHHAPRGDSAQPFRFEIALSYNLSGCTLLLNDVSLVVDGFYGDAPEQHSATSGGTIAIRADMRPRQKNGVPGFPASGEKEYRGICHWLTLWTAEGQPQARRLNCEAADKNWKVSSEGQRQRRPGGAVSRQQLAGKTIRVTLRMAEPPT